jgi:hypothetical protein
LDNGFDAWWSATRADGELRLDASEDTRNFDVGRRFRDLEADGVVAEVIYPNTLTPFAARCPSITTLSTTRSGARAPSEG